MLSNSWDREVLKKHRKIKGKIGIMLKAKIQGAKDLKTYYTPGVGTISTHLARHPEALRAMTIKGNSILIVSDGSAVLGLGNIGPAAALPVMEGKAMLFKKFGNIDAYPIVLATQDPEEIIKTIKYISPAFGGINLEDISAPRCFEIERRLINELAIPVMHDDQHATAIVVLAGLLNALKVGRKKLNKIKIVILGAGAAGNAVAKILKKVGARQILVLDRQGIIAPSRKGLDLYKKELARLTNSKNIRGELKNAVKDTDVIIGVSGPKLIKPEHIRLMKPQPIIFALSNPVPEIMPEAAKKAGAFIIATGRSDFPNQINNALVFPGLFRGALDHKIKRITDGTKIRTAYAIASLVKKPSRQKIIPSIFDKNLVKTVAKAIK